MALPRSRILEGKKFMWDGKEYETEAEARESAEKYEADGFETRVLPPEGERTTYEVYSRRVVTEVTVEGEP